jgi:hypothetical protein
MDDNGEKLVKDIAIDARFPGNSYNQKKKEAQEPKQKLEKVIKGSIVQKKKTLGARFASTFFGGSLKIAWNYILLSVLVPTIQNLFVDTVKGGVESWVFGEKGVNRNRGQEQNRPVVQYGGYFVNPRPTTIPQQRSDVLVFDNLIFDGRQLPTDPPHLGQAKADADRVQSGLLEILGKYGAVTVADLNNLIGRTGEFTDQNWGWTNLSTSSVGRVREGFLLNLPRPIFLEK